MCGIVATVVYPDGTQERSPMCDVVHIGDTVFADLGLAKVVSTDLPCTHVIDKSLDTMRTGSCNVYS